MKAITTIPLFLVIFILSSQLHAQGGLKGHIYNSQKETLSYAAIFVQETESGTTTNAKGYYELRLQPGDYQIVFQYLGYQSIVKKVSIGSTFKTIDITLKAEALNLQSVDVVGSSEDPAYTVMRKAIAKASYHRQQLDSYQVEIYMKGSGRLKDSPKLFENMIKKEGIDSTIAFTSESVSILKYQRPNTYEEEVISIYTRGNDNNTSPNSYIRGSFYEPKYGEAVSPLSPRAFGYYKFKHEGYFIDQGYGINKIRVIPRSRGEGVFEGLIYIVEDWWSIYSLSLKTYQLGFEIQIDQTYAPIESAAWLPVNQQFLIGGSIFGFNFEYLYLAAMSNYDITLNPELEATFEVIDETIEEVDINPITSEEDTTVKEKLETGKELTRKELRKLMREYEKAERKEQEEPEVVENSNFTIDSLARKRDSVYWQLIRPVPLTEQEVKGYQRADSIARIEAKEVDSLENIGVNKDGKFNFLSIIGGGSYKVKEGHYFAHSAIWDRFFFNPVEGFNLNADLSYAVSKENRFAITLTPRYAFARKKLTGKGNIGYTFGEGLRKHHTQIEGGRYIHQYNADNPLSYLFNSYLNLFEVRNYIRLYEKDYIKLSHAHKIKENWVINANVEWADRQHLNNNTDWTIARGIDREYENNIFLNREYNYPIPSSEKAFVVGLTLEARPWQRYRINNGVKEPINNSSPTIRLNYKQGIPDIGESLTDYSYAQFSYEHRFQLGIRGYLNLKAEAGKFLSNNYTGFADYRHFMGNRIFLISADPIGSYRLLPYYEYSTMDEFASMHVHYQFRKLAISRIPQIWLLGIKENVFVNYLATPLAKNYTEVGYSIDNIFRLFRIEAAVSFQDNKYMDWGIFFGISANIGGGVFTIE